LLLGIYLRWPATPQPLLWLDEAWRAFGAVDSHYGQILQFSELVLGRIGVALFGYQSAAMRVWPLLFSIAALTGTYAFLVRTSSRGVAVCAVMLIALGPGFVHHSREFKPYTMDLAFTVWTLWFTVRYVEEGGRRALAGLAAVLAAFAASSVVFVFIYPAVAVYLWLSVAPANRRALAPLVAAPIVFMTVYAFYLSPQILPGHMIDYWVRYYIDSPTALARIAADARFDIDWFIIPGWRTAVPAYFVLLPLLAIFMRDRVALLLLVPFVAQLSFAVAKLYPLFGRPSYYLYGLMAIVLPYGIAACLRWNAEPESQRSKLVDAALLVGVGLAMALNGPFHAQLAQAQRWPPEQGGDAFRLLGEHYQDGDTAFVNYAAYYTYRFHALAGEGPLADVTIATQSWNTALRDNAMGTLCRMIKRHVGSRAKGERLWFVSTHVPHAHVFYQELFRTIADVELVLGEQKQSLTLVTLQKRLDRLGCPTI
jgi:hypothetical protein